MGGGSSRPRSYSENTKGCSASSYSEPVNYSYDKDELEQMFKATNADKPHNRADMIDYALDNDEKFYKPLQSGKLSDHYVRNTNSTGVYWQRGGRCYAYAACSAYINTIIRMNSLIHPPTFKECYDIACYNEGYGGSSKRAIELLENHFHFGIDCDEVEPDKCSIRDALTISLIVSFSTSEQGWRNVANGKLIEYPGGVSDSGHACVVEGYDFDSLSLICKNSWGTKTAKARFLLKPKAAHRCSIIRVYFSAVRHGRIIESLNPLSENNTQFIFPMKGTYKGKPIDCEVMDEKEAIYSPVYICEKQAGNLYLGYDTEQWIFYNVLEKYGITDIPFFEPFSMPININGFPMEDVSSYLRLHSYGLFDSDYIRC